MTEGPRERGREAAGMRISAAAWLGWSLYAAAFSLLALALLLIVLGWSTPLPGGWVSWQGQAIYTVGLIGVPVLGGLVASRRPENPYGYGCGWD